MSPDTLRRVQQVIEESNYVSNMGARLLANYGSRLIGVIVTYDRSRDQSAVQDPFYSEIIGALEEEIRKNEYFMLLYTSANVDESVRMASAWNVPAWAAIFAPFSSAMLFAADTSTEVACWVQAAMDSTIVSASTIANILLIIFSSFLLAFRPIK